MLTSLITLPVRLSLRGAELGLRAGAAVAERAVDLLGEVLTPTSNRRRSDREPTPPSRRGSETEKQSPESKTRSTEKTRPSESSAADQPDVSDNGSGGDGDSDGDPRSAAPSPEQVVDEQEAIAAERRAPTPQEPPPPPPSPVSDPPDPVHVDGEETVVEEVAEPGAEEGAGPEIHIAEPWDGYTELKAAEVVDQLAGRDQAELAAVELYEVSHRKRQTVIDAAKRELRRAENAG